MHRDEIESFIEAFKKPHTVETAKTDHDCLRPLLGKVHTRCKCSCLYPPLPGRNDILWSRYGKPVLYTTIMDGIHLSEMVNVSEFCSRNKLLCKIESVSNDRLVVIFFAPGTIP